MSDEDEGMTYEPNLDDAAIKIVDRAIKALAVEFGDDRQVPRFVVVVEAPPDGRIGIASTGDDAVDAHRMLALGAGSVRSGMSPETLKRARAQWTQMGDLWKRRN